MPTDARAEVEARLRTIALRLLTRQAARAGVSALCGASLGLCVALVFLDALPRLLFNTHAGLGAVLTTGAIGLCIGAWWELRRFDIPTVHDAALAMEARLGHDTGALASFLNLPAASVFASPITTRARQELQEAESTPGPSLVSTGRLVLVPLLVLIAGVGLGLSITADEPATTVATTQKQPKSVDNWAAVDIGGSRNKTDQNALRDAMNLQNTASTLKESAATIRDTQATPSRRQNALDTARQSIAENEQGSTSGLTIPATLPKGESERAELADHIDEVASRMANAAEAIKDGTSGSEDSGTNGEFAVDNSGAKLVPFPPATTSSNVILPTEALAAQTPARRALAERAVRAFERIQNP